MLIYSRQWQIFLQVNFLLTHFVTCNLAMKQDFLKMSDSMDVKDAEGIKEILDPEEPKDTGEKIHLVRNTLHKMLDSKKSEDNEETEEEEGEEEEENKSSTAKKAGLLVLKTAAISGAVIGGTTVLLPLIGFGAMGPIAGSLVATYQSTVLGGTIASGSTFASLQSLGMAGMSVAAKLGIIGGSAAVSAITTKGNKKKKKKPKDTEKEKEEQNLGKREINRI